MCDGVSLQGCVQLDGRRQAHRGDEAGGERVTVRIPPAGGPCPPNVNQTAVSILEALHGRASLALGVAERKLTASCRHHECHDAERGVVRLHICGRRFTAHGRFSARRAGHGSWDNMVEHRRHFPLGFGPSHPPSRGQRFGLFTPQHAITPLEGSIVMESSSLR